MAALRQVKLKNTIVKNFKHLCYEQFTDMRKIKMKKSNANKSLSLFYPIFSTYFFT